MATTSSRQTSLFGVQDWKRIYQSYRSADLTSYDYATLRKSFIDYLTQNYPENFNDYTENSEYVALLDVIAFMGQALAFRGDLNARENFIDTAERRDSVIKLANLVSYNPKRNTAGQGLVKVTAISTTEDLTDINGTNLSNVTILWNDPANPYWQEQFNTIINASLINSQRIGRPGNTQSILGIKTEEYSINLPNTQSPVIPYVAQIDGVNMNFELVNVTSLNADYLYELPPAPNSQFNILYRNDKLGYGSNNTGFFFYFKQGTLQNLNFSFAEQIENNFQQIDIEGINNTDTWLYKLNNDGTISTLWNQVDNLYTNYNLAGNSQRNVFSVVSRTNDQVTYVFGDGVFGEMPVGPFRAYVRAGNALTYTINPSEMNGIVASINYVSRVGSVETLTFTFSLQTTANTALQRETLTQIKERAPARYYTQNRMVNGEDYTNFPFTLYNSIIKSKAVNRSSIGVSRNQDLLDPTGKYSSTNVFGDDGALYASDISAVTTFSTLSTNLAVEFLSQSLPVYLSTPELIQYYFENFPRYTGYYTGTQPSSDGKVYWKKITLANGSVTGYFYTKNLTQEYPLSVGDVSTSCTQYITPGSLLKFSAPPNKYFDSDNRLANGVPTATNGGRSFIWVSVDGIVGDGSNYGVGVLSNGKGPVTLSNYVPSDAYLYIDSVTPSSGEAIIASFDNTLGNLVVRDALTEISLKNNFYLDYDNSLLTTQQRWSVVTASSSNTLVTFVYDVTSDSYQVFFKNRTYFFGSVSEVKFLWDREKKVFDPKSGKTLVDYINVFKTNSNPDYSGLSSQSPILGIDYPLFVTGQQLQSDGYPDDYAVQVSTIDVNTLASYDPDFFYTIVGSSPTAWVFFKIITVDNDFYNYQLLPPGTINYSYSTKAAIEAIKYEYPAGSVFYATSENKFYESVQQPASQPPVLDLVDVTTQYSKFTGRGDIDFQYRHNSNNTTRIDPATTNIIDLYLVTQSYYTQYQNWLTDITGTVPEPSRPTIDELQQAYGGLDNFKMISDSLIPNSVTFKPLFGIKAEPALQGTIKVIKSPSTTASDSQIRSSVLAALNSYFTLDKWDFGDTFYFSELTAYLHVQLAGLISSVVLVSNNPSQPFGDLYEIRSAPNEIFVNGATVRDVTVIAALTPQNLQQYR